MGPGLRALSRRRVRLLQALSLQTIQLGDAALLRLVRHLINTHVLFLIGAYQQLVLTHPIQGLCDCIVDCFCNKREKYPNDVFLYLRCISKFDCDFITLLENQNIIDNIKIYYQTKTYRKFQKKNEEKFKYEFTKND